MTDKQPEALRLAEYCDQRSALEVACGRELRQLCAENEDFRATIDYLTRENAEQIGEIVALKEQRDELLEALRKLHHGLDECDMVHDDQRSAYANASAIIAKATGETK